MKSNLSSKMTRDIDIKNAENKDLVSWYNENSGSSPIKKFKDRATAEARCAELKQALIELAGGSSKKGAAKDKPAKAAKGSGSDETGATSEPGMRGRKSAYAGKSVFIKTEGKANPRREGTNGHRSFSIIKDGMTYEDFILKGGRSIDLAWDLAKGHLEVK